MFEGMPIGLQIVGRRFDDEKIVAILEYLMQHGAVGRSPYSKSREEG